jgi:hypothetical protein
MSLIIGAFAIGVFLGSLCGWFVTMVFYKIISCKEIKNSRCDNVHQDIVIN